MPLTAAYVAGRNIGALLGKVAADAATLEKALANVAAREEASEGRKDPVNEDVEAQKNTDGNSPQWGPEQAVSSKNDLSTWGGNDSVSRY